MQRLTKKLYNKQYILKDMRDFPLCVYMFCKDFKKIRKQINKIGKLEDSIEDIIHFTGLTHQHEDKGE
jgi:hypothetical protein